MMSADGRLPARDRIRFAKGVAAALQSLEGAELLGPDPDVGLRNLDLPSADFLLVVLDLRLRVVLDYDGFTDGERLDSAQRLLEQWPDSDAVAIVTPDEALTTLVYEPFDVMAQLNGGQRGPTEGPGPLPDVLIRYLQVLAVEWPQPIPLMRDTSLDLSVVGSNAAEASFRALQLERPRVTEKAEGLQQALAVPVEKVSDLLREVVRASETAVDVERAIDRLLGR